MKERNLINIRVRNQGLVKPLFDTPSKVVEWFCAMQAQDYLGALWAVGQRARVLENEVEEAIRARQIVRTWPMRGTLHFVAAQDVRWMLSLLAPRVIKKAASIYKQQGLDPQTMEKGRKVIEKSLEKNGQLTRQELYDALVASKIDVSAQRGLHLIGYAAQQQSICIGPRVGKQHTFVLLDEWVPQSRKLTLDESLGEVVHRYFDARGPATKADLAWWTGLTLTEINRGLEISGDSLIREEFMGQEYWLKSVPTTTTIPSPTVSLLSWFDEYIIAYKDRSAAFDPVTRKFIAVPKNGIYSPVFVIDGKIAGVWKRTLKKGEAIVEVTPFRKLSEKEKIRLDREILRYQKFLSKE